MNTVILAAEERKLEAMILYPDLVLSVAAVQDAASTTVRLESFHLGVWLICKGPGRVGQIQSVGIGTEWRHYNCDGAAKDEKLLHADQLLLGEEI